MNKIIIFMTLFITFNLFGLSTEAKIDILKIKLVEQQKKADYKAIINSINEWKKLDPNLPISLVYWEGKSYYQIKDYIKSFNSLEKYINTAGSEGRFYQDALKLYLDVEPKYKQELKKEELRKKTKDRIVTFENTGLMWQDDYDVVSKKMNSNQAVKYCANLKLAGYNDWRVPTANEFMSIVDYSKKPAIREEFKSIETSPKYYPYQHIYEKNYSATYYVSNYDGHIKYSTNNKYEIYTRCVRSIK